VWVEELSSFNYHFLLRKRESEQARKRERGREREREENNSKCMCVCVFWTETVSLFSYSMFVKNLFAFSCSPPVFSSNKNNKRNMYSSFSPKEEPKQEDVLFRRRTKMTTRTSE